MSFVLVDTVDEVLEAALCPPEQVEHKVVENWDIPMFDDISVELTR
jgi:hypothetical protein